MAKITAPKGFKIFAGFLQAGHPNGQMFRAGKRFGFEPIAYYVTEEEYETLINEPMIISIPEGKEAYDLALETLPTKEDLEKAKEAKKTEEEGKVPENKDEEKRQLSEKEKEVKKDAGSNAREDGSTHILTEQDLKDNPELEKQGLKVGDEVEVQNEEETDENQNTPEEDKIPHISKINKEELIKRLEAKGMVAGKDFEADSTKENLYALLTV
jgi:hypothetical protein